MAFDPTDAVQQPIQPSGAWLGPGDRVRDWVLGPSIGEGGTSVVFQATRTAGEFEQHAALKLLRTGAGDAGFTQRFQREREILLTLRHPHIVRLLDGGSTDSGVPWFAMEHIDGAPLTTWCAGRPLPDRLARLLEVCDALGFAHQRLVVHCDLKPANVLVDGSGTAHVLDFGIAKLLDGSEQTRTGRMLTPRWAAPEQVAGETVTTATDVYALGVLMWSVLTEHVPYDALTGQALLAAVMQRDLPPPSQTNPACRGDLDAIVLRATAHEPADRYASVAELADDIRRHLRGEAVRAREGVLWYQTSRWMRKNRGVVAAASLLAILVIGWAVTATTQSARISAERDRARNQAERAEATLTLLVDMLEAADPARARGEELTVREVLNAGALELESASGDPALQGEVGRVVGSVQHAVGATDEARASLRQALERLQRVYPADHPIVLRTELQLAIVDHAFDWRDASAIERAVAAIEGLERHGPTVELARGLQSLAEMHAGVEEYDAALARIDQSREAFLALGDARMAARARAVRGFVLFRMDQQETGRAEVQQALEETVTALGTRKHPAVVDILHELALITPFPDSLPIVEESVALRRELFGEVFALAATINNYGLAMEQVDPVRSQELMAEAVRIATATRGADHPDVVGIRISEAAVFVDTGRVEEGAALLRIAAPLDGLDGTTRARGYRHLGRAEQKLGNLDASRVAFERALEAAPPQSPLRPILQESLAALPQ